MTGWDILNDIMKNFPPIAATVLFLAATAIFIIGFSKHGFNFLKYGFNQKEVGDLSKKIDNLRAEFKAGFIELRTEFKADFVGLRTEFKADNDRLGIRIDGLHTELETIKVNHFGHLKNFLTELTSILLDKDIINNENKARLDNQLRGM
jgi:hypothetical protein